MSGPRSSVLEALQYACSQEVGVLKVGEQQLKSWETENGFYSTLASIVEERTLEPGVRWMALTCIKNGVDRYWRPGAPNAIVEEEKVIIRATLLQCVEEPVQQVSTQLVVLMARIARIDCPAHWPELLPLLTKGVQSSSPLLQKCSLTAMKYTIKTLAGRRLANQRKAFYDITRSLFVYIAKLWTVYLQESMAQQLPAGGLDSLEMSRICLKILRQMIVHGFMKFHTVLEALQFLHQIFERIPVFLRMRSQLSLGHLASAALEQNIRLMMKTLLDVQSHHPVGFVSLLTPSLQLVSSFIFNPANEAQLFEKFTIQSLSLLRQIIQCEDYTLPSNLRLYESSPPPHVLEAQQAKLNFFKAPTSHAMIERLICHYMPLSLQELKVWEDDPEDFVQEKAGEIYEHSLRKCVETTYVTLFHEYQLSVMPAVLQLISTAQTTDSLTDFDSIRVKEAVYKAAGLGAYQLYDEIDFDSWYQGPLIRELQITHPRYKIIRHRVVWLIGNWATVKVSSSLLPSIYSSLLSALQPQEDIVIRVTAADSLKMVIEDFSFSVDEFSQNLGTSVRLLVQLLLDLSQCDTKLRVLLVLSALIERMGPSTILHISSLVQCLPQLWTDSALANSSLLRVGILSILVNVVRGIRGDSAQLHGFILPVIQLATDVKSPDHVYLMEEGLDLWIATLHHTPSSSPALLDLLGNMTGLLGLSAAELDSTTNFSGNNLDMCFKILDGYCFLYTASPDQFMQSCTDVVLKACRSYLNDVKSEGVAMIVKVLEHVVQFYPSQFPSLLPPILPTILTNLLEGRETHPLTISAYLSLLARVLLQNSSFFFSFLEQMATQVQQSTQALFGHLIDHWSDKLDDMTKMEQRKLTGLAVTAILPVPDQCVTSRFGVLVNMCVEVLHDVIDTTENDVLYDQLVSSHETQEPSGALEETEHEKRERQLAMFDPVRTISFHIHVARQLEECATVHGAAGYGALMQSVDGSVKEQLAAFLPREYLRSLLALDTL